MSAGMCLWKVSHRQGEAELMLGRRLRPSSAPASAMLKIWTSWISQMPWVYSVYSYNLATLSCMALSIVVFVKWDLDGSSLFPSTLLSYNI